MRHHWRIPPPVWVIGIAVVVLAFWTGYSRQTHRPRSRDPRRACHRTGRSWQPAGRASGRRAAGSPPLKPPPRRQPRKPGPRRWSRLQQRPRQPDSRTSPTGPPGRSSGSRQEANTGSGFFVAPDTVLTNAHVVPGAWSVTIRRFDGSTRAANVAASSSEVDIAVLRVLNPDASQQVLPLGSAARVRSGQEVIAVGSPLGVLQSSVTRGIVSAVRAVGGVTLVQTDAAINPGNSGGPLVTREGDVIGIATMTAASAQGLSFAVGIDHARALLAGGQPPARGRGRRSRT